MCLYVESGRYKLKIKSTNSKDASKQFVNKLIKKYKCFILPKNISVSHDNFIVADRKETLFDTQGILDELRIKFSNPKNKNIRVKMLNPK